MFSFQWAKRTHKGLRRWILYIVKDHPRTGAEIMDVMEGNLQGWWRPSPGSIYPLLDTMVLEGVLARSQDKQYSLTARGLEEIERPFPWMGRDAFSTRTPAEVTDLISSYVSYLEDIAHSDKAKLKDSAGKMRELGEKLVKLGEEP